MKTIAQQIKWDFEANGSLIIKDKYGNLIYSEYADGYWKKWENDSEDNKTYYESSTGYWEKKKYDSKGNLIYLENSQDGVVIDRQPESCETKVVEIDGVKYKLTKI